MQNKIDNWVETYSQHQSRKMWIVTDTLYKVEVPEGFDVQFHKWTLEKGIAL